MPLLFMLAALILTNACAEFGSDNSWMYWLWIFIFVCVPIIVFLKEFKK